MKRQAKKNAASNVPKDTNGTRILPRAILNPAAVTAYSTAMKSVTTVTNTTVSMVSAMKVAPDAMMSTMSRTVTVFRTPESTLNVKESFRIMLNG